MKIKKFSICYKLILNFKVVFYSFKIRLIMKKMIGYDKGIRSEIVMGNDEKNKVIQRIQELCKEQEVSIYKLAIRSKIPNTTLTNMISKNTMPTVPTIEKICDAFDITLSQFFSSESIFGLLSKEQAEILDMWTSLDEQGKALAKAYLKGLCRKI